MSATAAFPLLAAILAGAAAYAAAPSVAARLRRDLRSAAPKPRRREPSRGGGSVPAWLAPVRAKAAKTVAEAGYRAAWSWIGYLVCLYGAPAILLVLGMLVGMTEGDLAEQREELALCEAMVAEIKADLAAKDMSTAAAQDMSGSNQIPGG